MSVWEGESSSMIMAAPNASAQYLASTCTSLSPQERDGGVVLDGAVDWLDYPAVIFDVDGMAIFEIEPVGRGALSAILPNRPGTRIRDKEVFVTRPGGAAVGRANPAAVQAASEDDGAHLFFVKGQTYSARIGTLEAPPEETLERINAIDLEFSR